MNLQKTIIFSTLFLDILGIAIIIPAFPDLKVYYGITDFQVTLGLTVYALFAFLAAPVLGQLSDKFGRKKPLLLCVLGTMLSYLLLLTTQQYWIFLLSRVLNGITGGNISILQAILTDISPDQATKTKNYGMMGAFFGLGFIIGPVLGALLLKFGSIETIFWFGALFGFVELALIAVQFKNTNEPQVEKKLNYSSFHIIGKYLRKDELRSLLISLFLLGVGGFIINGTMSLFMHSKFGTSGETYGYILGFAGVIAAANLGFLIPKFWIKQFTHKQLLRITHIAYTLGYLLLGRLGDPTLFLVAFYITILFGGIYMPVYSTLIMSKAHRDEIGEISGMLGGTQSLLMFVGPLIGGLLLATKLNIFRGAMICVLLSMIVMFKFLIKRDPELHTE